MRQFRSSIWVIGALVGLALALFLYPVATLAARPGSLQAVWERVRQAGFYRFSADVVQTTRPLPTVTNVGRTTRQDRVHLEGKADLTSRTLYLTLWSQGGNILNARSGVEARIEGDRALVRRAGEPWQEVEDFTALFAPEGDFMAYLAAARDVVEHEPETRAGVTFTRYTFRIDGRAFAAYLRDQLQRRLVETGELPPGVELDLPRTLVEMTGEGELWVGRNGLPIRQTLHLQFPDRDDHQVSAQVAVDFFGFGPVSRGLTALVHSPSRSTTRLLHQISFFLLTLASIVLLVAYRHVRKVYAALVLFIIASLVITPLLQSAQAADFARRQAERVRQQEEATAENDLGQRMRELLAESDSLAPGGPAALEMIESDTGRDTDGDGLTDVQETFLGTDPHYPDADALPTFVEPAPLLQETGEDSDGDGLTDYQERLLGTNPNIADSDGDLITDTLEVQGFSYAGRVWYTDPLEMDTNDDGLSDGQEWFVDANGDRIPDDADGDGIPDVLDDDNDGDGVPDNLDLAPYFTTMGTRTFSDDSPFSLVVDHLNPGYITYVEFQLRPTNPDHLWYAFNVLDWPDGDKQGQMQDEDGATFYDLDSSTDPAVNDLGDVKLIPMLQVLIPGEPDNLPSEEVLSHYGIAVADLPDGGKAAYIPLQLVTVERGDREVAFYGKMIYLPTDTWGEAHEVRLVWVIQALVDVCEEVEDGICTEYSERNRLQVLHAYDDEWYLTGLSVREDHGTDVAAVYEDPDVDDNLDDDSNLFLLAYGLESTFLAGRTGEDGERDLTLDEIYRRFDHATNDAVSDEERWNTDDVFTVITYTYTHRDEAFATLAMTETKDLLDSTFTSHWSSSDPITPTLMFAREERFRAVGMDAERSEPDLFRWNDDRLTVDMDPDRVPLQTAVGLNWAPYMYDPDTGEWLSCPIETYLEELETRYRDAAYDPDPYVAKGQMTVFQILYLTLYRGVTVVVEIGEVILERQSAELDSHIGFSVAQVAGNIIVFLVQMWVMRGYFDKTSFLWVLGRLMERQRFSRGGWTNPLAKIWSWIKALVNKFRVWWQTGQLRTYGAVMMVTIAAVIAVGVGIYLLVKNYIAGDPTARAILAVIAGILLGWLFVVAPILQTIELVNALQIMREVGVWTAVRQALTSTSQYIGVSRIAAAIGLIIAVGITWGVFIYTVCHHDIPPGSIAFNMLLAQTIASTIITILMFIIASTVIGAIIVGIISLIDIILTILGVDFTITGWLVEGLAEIIHNFQVLVDTSIETGGFSMSLVNPEEGMVSGASVGVGLSITTTAVHTNPQILGAKSHLDDAFNEGTLRDTAFQYELSTISHTLPVESGARYNEWQVQVDRTRRYLYYGVHKFYRGDLLDHPSTVVTLSAGINVTMPLYLNSGFAIPCFDCWNLLILSFCSGKSITGTVSVAIGDAIILDVFPRTLDEFFGLAWVGEGSPFLHQRDHDGDGLVNPYFGGNDPDDGNPDADGDGLSDAYELQIRSIGVEDGGAYISPLSADSDMDGLCDAQEIQFGTDPGRRDTDGDGLDDGEEVYHLDLCDGDHDGDTTEWLGGWTFTVSGLTTIVTSNPLLPDTDGDGMSDLAERTLHQLAADDYPFNPNVYNESPIALYVEADDEDGFVRPGQSLVYTATVQNNLSTDLYALGTFTVTPPVFLDGGVVTATFNIFRDEWKVLTQTFTVDAGASSATADVTNEMSARLHNGDTRVRWTWDPPRQETVGSTGATLRGARLTQATGALYDYLVASLEGSDAADSRYTRGTVNLRHAESSFSGANGVSWEWGVDRPNGYGPARERPGVACNDAGRCLTSWVDSYFYHCTDIRFTRIRCINEDDPGDNGEYYLVMYDGVTGPEFWSYRRNNGISLDDGESYTFPAGTGTHFCDTDRLEIWEDDVGDDYDDRVGYLYFTANAPDSFRRRVNQEGGTDDEVELSGVVEATNTEAVYGAISDENRTVVVSQFAIGDDDLTRKFRPIVASDGQDFLVVWYRDGVGLKARRVYDDGTTGGQVVLDIRAEQAALTWIGDSYLLVWADDSDGDWDVRGVRLNRNGGRVGDSFVVAGSSADEAHPAVAYDPVNDRALVLYVEDGVRVEGRFFESGSPGTAFVVYSRPGAPSLGQPVVAYEPLYGIWFAAWQERYMGTDQYFLHARPLDAGGQFLLSTSDTALEDQTSPRSSFTDLETACSEQPALQGGDTARCATLHRSGTTRMTLERFYIRRVLPWLGTLSRTERVPFTVDDDVPTATFTSLSDGQFVAVTDTLIVGGDAGDPTSYIARVEVRVDGGPWEEAEGAESWAYAWDVSALADGAHTLSVRAVDAVGNTGPAATITVHLDRVPPVVSVTVPASNQIVGASRGADGRWAVSLAGMVSDGGAGVDSVETLLSPNGAGWQTASLTLPDWALDYRLPRFRDDGSPLNNPTGFYTLTVRATDRLGNQTPETAYTQVAFGVDTTPPVADVRDTGPSTTTITQTLLVTGVITDPGAAAIGVQSLQIAYTPGGEEPQDWLAATVASPGAVTSAWSHRVPADLEGLYTISLRGTDGLGNRNDDTSAWPQWQGEIDTAAPRSAITVTYQGAGSAAQTIYEGRSEDFNLSTEGYRFVCPIQAEDREGYDEPWWNDVVSDTTRLYRVTPTCIRNGLAVTAPTLRACDVYSHCETVTGTLPSGYTPPTIASTVLTPAHESAITTLSTVTLHIGSYALDGLGVVTVTANGDFVAANVWPPTSTVTDAVWTSPWLPPAEGVYRLETRARDRDGDVQAVLQPITVTVDRTPPGVEIDTLVFTTTHQLSPGRVLLTGDFTETVGLEAVEVSVNGGEWMWADTSHGWRVPWCLDEWPDPDVYTLTLRATDGAGHTTLITRVVTVDINPPDPVTATIAYTDSLGVRRVLTAGQTVYEAAPTLIVTWTASSDGSGIAAYRAGWTPSYTDTSGLAVYGPTARAHTQAVNEPTAVYAHVVAVDGYGNRTGQMVGPIYVDGPDTPDYIGDLDYHGWLESGCSQVSADAEAARHAAANSAITETQRFYVSWDASALRFTWTGADWDAAGDLFIYLDVAAGGSTTAYDPYGTGPAVTLPDGMGADYLVWVESDSGAWLMHWTGSTWQVQTALDAGHFQVDTNRLPVATDVLVPFGGIGIADPAAASLRLVALASEEEALRIWAAAPDKNPLNSARATNPLATACLDQDFALTQSLYWPSLDLGVCPNQGRFADADLRVRLTAAPVGLTVGFLQHDLPGLLTPGQPLDGDLDGEPDVDLPLDVQPALLGDGQVVTYTLIYTNGGAIPAPGARVTVTARGGVELAGGSPQVFVLSGASGTLQITGTVNAALDGESAELDAVVADAVHGQFDWLWVQHDVDTAPPVDLTVQSPMDYAAPYTNTVRGTVVDPSGVPLIELEVREQGAAVPTTLLCPDDTPDDGEWECVWNAGGAADGTVFQIRARATDRFGNVGDWTDWVDLTADATRPAISLSDGTLDAMSDGLLMSAETDLSGTVSDDRRAGWMTVCASEVGRNGEECARAEIGPSGGVTGTWYVPLPIHGYGDGSQQTLTFYGFDSVGNRSSPVTRTLLIDVVPPALTVDYAARGAILFDPTTVLTGTVRDGYGVDRVEVRVRNPDDDVHVETAALSGTGWEFATTFPTMGRYVLGVDAVDRAGNIRTWGTVDVMVYEGGRVADLSVSQAGSSDPAITSHPFTYTVTVANHGPSDATSTTLTFTLPSTVVFLGATPDQGVCGPRNGDLVVCDLGTIADQAATHITFRVHVPLTTTGKLSSLAQVASGKADFSEGDNQAELYVPTYQPITGLMAASDGPTPLGDPARFTATVETGTDVVYTWSFGDGITATGQTISHTYAEVGRYTAVVTARNAIDLLTATVRVPVDVPVGVPLVEADFEGGFPPDGWSLVSLDQSSDDPGWRDGWAHTRSGSFSAFHNDLFGMYDSWMVTPLFTPTINSELIFWQYQKYAHLYYHHSIWVSTGRGDPKYGDFVPLVEDLGPGTEGAWEEVRISLADVAGRPIYLAFRYEGDFADEWYVDDVEVTAGLYALNDGPKSPGEVVTLWVGVGSGTNITYTWSFGDGITATGQVVTHTYATPGDYTAVVTAANTVSALTTTTTVRVRYAVYLPLVASNYLPPCHDVYEPDDTVDQSTPIPTDGTAQRHNFHRPGDVDWIAFDVLNPALDYLIETFDLSDTDTVIYLYDSDGERLLDWNDDAAPGTSASRLLFNPYHTGTFYVKIVQYDPSTGGCDQEYSVRVTTRIERRPPRWE